MKYECLECHKVFVYAAISSFAKDTSETIEFHVCPYCFSKDIDEIHESRRIESIQSVKINEADALLKQGYEVKDTYASSVTLVKYAVPAEKKTEEQAPEEALADIEITRQKEEEGKTTLKERQEALDEESKRLREDLKGFTET